MGNLRLLVVTLFLLTSSASAWGGPNWGTADPPGWHCRLYDLFNLGKPKQSCPKGQVDVEEKDSHGCTVHACRTQFCLDLVPPPCGVGEFLVKKVINGCPTYVCQPAGGPDPDKCPMLGLMCPDPRPGCRFVPEKNAQGCVVGCGHLTCDGKDHCPMLNQYCPKPPPGCAYVEEKNLLGCPSGCGHLACTNDPLPNWRPPEPWGRCDMIKEVYCKDGMVKRIHFEKGCPVFTCAFPPGAPVPMNENNGDNHGKPGGGGADTR